MDFEDMIEHHEKSGADISIATIPVTAKDATGFGILKTDEDNYITSFIEKPKAAALEGWDSEVSDDMRKQGRKYLASMGIYIFNRKALFDTLNINGTHTDFGKEIIPDAITSHKVLSYQYEGYWTDIGSIPSFFEANIGLTDDIPAFNLFDKHSIYSRPRMLPPSKISGTILDKTIISDGCIINASRIERSVIGVRTRIGSGTTIVSSYIMGSDYYQTLDQLNEAADSGTPIMGIGERCYIKNAILDKNCQIGDDVRINGGLHIPDGEYDLYTVREGIIVVKKSVVIPNGTAI
jgi:glucose-1-phosphate adenylyltransferase